MTGPETLLPLVVLAPLGMAALLATIAHWLPSRMADVLAILTALGIMLLCGWLAGQATGGPIVHWFGGWTPDAAHRPGVILGIAFVADPASAALAAFCALLFAASFLFAWGYFDEVHSHFHILMLLFLAAMEGFCLTHDLFNLFVWFELMSVAAFALTAYPLGQSSLEGAFSFTVTNSFASFMMLMGIGLLYAGTGTLDFTAIGQAMARHGPDPVILGGFCLIAAALLTKAAILPFHFWLSDAHAVAPTPVSVIFSGVMVGLGLFALTKLGGQSFGAGEGAMAPVRALLLWLGVATAVVGGLMTWGQRHLKRLLAFSTVSHLGIMLLAVSALKPLGAAALLLYLVGQGLVKAALFMVAGILLALRASADEIALYREGRGLWPAGVVMILGGLILGGLPIGLLHGGGHLIHAAVPSRVAEGAIILSTALTGAAVLRAGLRIFPGWSGVPGVERGAPTEREHEKADRPLWLMVLPGALLLVLVLAPSSAAFPFLAAAAPRLLDPWAAGIATLPEEGGTLASGATFAATLALVAMSLLRRRPTGRLARLAAWGERLPFRALEAAHSGVVSDYVTWMTAGLALLAVAAASWR